MPAERGTTFRRTAFLLLAAVLVAGNVFAQEPDSAAIEAIESPLERARLLLRNRQFDRALDAAIEAGEQFGLPSPSIGPHGEFPFVSERIPEAFLYRGLALEMQRQFAEARADYGAFLDLEPTGARAEELGLRMRYVNVQSLRTLGRRIRDGEEISPKRSRFDVGVFPFYNSSDILLMDQVGFALTGVLLNALEVLEHFVDVPLTIVPRVDLRSLLDEVLPSEVYAGASPIRPAALSRALGSRFVVTGSVNEVLGSLSAGVEIGALASDSVITIPAIQSSYSPAGLERLQRELVFLVADELERVIGFSYVPDKSSFADSLHSYLLTEVDRFLEYGFATEQVLLGDLEEAEQLLLDSGGQAAENDVTMIPLMLGADSPPADNLAALTGEGPSVYGQLPVVAADTADVTSDSDQTAEAELPSPRRATRGLVATAVQTASFNANLGSRSLGNIGIGTWETGVDAFNLLSGLNGDPRDGKPATLDPTRMPGDHVIRVVVPVPRSPNAAGAR